MYAAEFIVKGNVQRVGYRNFVSQTAFELGVNGFVENLEDESVKIVVQGNNEKLAAFAKRIHISEWPVVVKSIERRKIKTKERFIVFKIIRGEPQSEMIERADEAVLLLSNFRQETKQSFSELNNNLGTKMDQNIEETKKLGRETKQNFNKLDENLRETKRFRQDTTQSFVKLDKKYGSVSKTLKRIDGNIVKGLKRIDKNISNGCKKQGSASKYLKGIDRKLGQLNNNIVAIAGAVLAKAKS